MKALKIIVVSLVALLVVLVLGVVVLSFPGVQRGIALSILREEGREVEIDYLRVRSGGLVAREVSIREHGERYDVESVDAEVSLWDALFHREIKVGRVKMEGVVADLSASTREPEDEPFDGVLAGLDFPFPVWIEEVDIAGEVRFSVGTEVPPARAEFSLSGGGVAPGEEGVFTLVGRATDSDGALFAEPIDLAAEIGLRQGASGGIDRVTLSGDLMAAGITGSDGQAMGFAVTIAGEEESERYRAEIFSRKPGGDRRRLAGLEGTFNRRDRLVSGDWELTADSEPFSGAIAADRLPEFVAEGEGSFRYEFAGGAFEAAGAIEGELRDPETIAEELSAVGPVRFVAQFDFGFLEEAIRLDALELKAGPVGEEPYLIVTALESVRYSFRQGVINDEERIPLAGVRLNGIPAAWISALSGPGEEGWRFESGHLSGRARLGVEGERFFFETEESFLVEDLTLFEGDEEALRGVGIRIAGSGSMRHDGAEPRGRIDELIVSETGSELVRATGSYSGANAEAEGVVEIDLAGLARQPMFEAIESLKAGTFHLQGSYRWREARGVSGKIRFTDGVAAGEEEDVRLPRVLADFEITEKSEGRWQIGLPVEVELAGKTSRFAVTGQVVQASPVDVDLLLEGEVIRVEDLLYFAGILGEQPEAPDERDETPFWAGITGKVELRIAELILPGDEPVSNLHGESTISADAVQTRATAVALDGPMEVSGDLGFNVADERPYRLNGNAVADRLDVGVMFREVESSRPPSVEGLFQISAAVEAEGRNVSDLVERIRGEITLESGGGSYRMLRSDNPIAGLSGALGNLLGSRGGDVGRGVANLAETLSHIRYDRLSLRVVRNEDFDIILHDLLVQATELRVQGAGIVRHREGVPLLQQPLEMEIHLAARGDVQRLLHSLGALSAERDPDEYRRLRSPFRIGGTLAQPDANDLYRRIGRGALNLLGSSREEEAGEKEEEAKPGPLDILDEILRRSGR